MKLTNKANLPEPMVKAISNDSYDRGDCDFTVTELLRPPRESALVARHYDEIEEDASDLIWRLMGQIGHSILERAADPNYSEQRFYAVIAGKKVGGRCDLHFDHAYYHIWDYKYTSLYTTKEGIKPEWEQQINMLRYLCHCDLKIALRWLGKGSICAIYRDWSKRRARRESDYPPHQVQVFPVKIWSAGQTLKFMEGRVRAHLEARKVLPRCTDEDRWATQEKWAVKKKGAKRAEKLFDNEQIATFAAHQWGMEIEHRPKEFRRCVDYCLAYPFCDQANPNLMEKPC